MSDVTLRRRIAALVVMAFLSVMGATVAAATVAVAFADAQPCIAGKYSDCENPRDREF
jgi:hypothetical protein